MNFVIDASKIINVVHDLRKKISLRSRMKSSALRRIANDLQTLSRPISLYVSTKKVYLLRSPQSNSIISNILAVIKNDKNLVKYFISKLNSAITLPVIGYSEIAEYIIAYMEFIYKKRLPEITEKELEQIFHFSPPFISKNNPSHHDEVKNAMMKALDGGTEQNYTQFLYQSRLRLYNAAVQRTILKIFKLDLSGFCCFLSTGEIEDIDEAIMFENSCLEEQWISVAFECKATWFFKFFENEIKSETKKTELVADDFIDNISGILEKVIKPPFLLPTPEEINVRHETLFHYDPTIAGGIIGCLYAYIYDSLTERLSKKVDTVTVQESIEHYNFFLISREEPLLVTVYGQRLDTSDATNRPIGFLTYAPVEKYERLSNFFQEARASKKEGDTKSSREVIDQDAHRSGISQHHKDFIEFTRQLSIAKSSCYYAKHHYLQGDCMGGVHSLGLPYYRHKIREIYDGFEMGSNLYNFRCTKTEYWYCISLDLIQNVSEARVYGSFFSLHISKYIPSGIPKQSTLICFVTDPLINLISTLDDADTPASNIGHPTDVTKYLIESYYKKINHNINYEIMNLREIDEKYKLNIPLFMNKSTNFMEIMGISDRIIPYDSFSIKELENFYSKLLQTGC